MLPVVGPSPLSVNPVFESGPLEQRYFEWLFFGVCRWTNRVTSILWTHVTIAYNDEERNCIKDHLSQFNMLSNKFRRSHLWDFGRATFVCHSVDSIGHISLAV